MISSPTEQEEYVVENAEKRGVIKNADINSLSTVGGVRFGSLLSPPEIGSGNLPPLRRFLL